MLNVAYYLSNNWGLTNEFSVEEVLYDLDKSCFSGVLRIKARLEWIQ